MMGMTNLLAKKTALQQAVLVACVLLLGWRIAAAEPVLVDADWVNDRLDDPSVVVVDMASEGTQYQRFHLPGAVYLPYRAIVQRRRDGVIVRVDDERLFRILGALGITADTHVVVYDDMGGLQAGRLFWELERIAHPRVSVLDGGLVRWILDGRPVMAAPVRPTPVRYVPVKVGGRQNEASLEAVKSLNSDSKAVLLDVRSKEEYQGDQKSKARTGHIPGAKWWPWDGAVAFDSGFRRKPLKPLQQSLADVGAGDTDQPIITYCRTGHRASQAYLTLRSLGYQDVRVFDGSMVEYERDPKAPLRLGLAP